MGMSEGLTLKWGTVKGWSDLTERSQELLKKYLEDAPWSAMADHPTKERREILCQLIDQLEGDIWNDWDGRVMPKDEAKKYVLEYRS